MTAGIVLGYGLALVIGLSLGLLGGGGSILTVPVLHYVLGYGVKAAVPMSLVVVGLTSGVGALRHHRGGTVNGRAALAFGPPAIAGALIGADLGLRVSAATQITVFAVVVLAAAVSMLLGPGRIASAASPPRNDAIRSSLRGAEGPEAISRPARAPVIALVGAAVGLVTGFVGVGGGFLYVPALVLLGGLPMKEAIGTSLVLIMLSCIAGVARYQGSLDFDWTAIALFTAIAMAGVLAGTRLSRHVAPEALRRGFAVFLLVIGLLVLLRGR